MIGSNIQRSRPLVTGQGSGYIEQVPGFVVVDPTWMEVVSNDLMAYPPAAAIHYIYPENQCGKDNRVRIADTTLFPWNAICSLYIEGRTVSGKASGFFVSPQCIITAGHVVYPDRHWLNAITIVPGQDGNNAPFGTQRLNRNQNLMTSAPIEWLRDAN